MSSELDRKRRAMLMEAVLLVGGGLPAWLPWTDCSRVDMSMYANVCMNSRRSFVISWLKANITIIMDGSPLPPVGVSGADMNWMIYHGDADPNLLGGGDDGRLGRHLRRWSARPW